MSGPQVQLFASCLTVFLHWTRPRARPRQRQRPMQLGSMIMFRSVHTEPRLRPMQISFGSVHILSVSVAVSVSGSVNEPLRSTFYITVKGAFQYWGVVEKKFLFK